MTRTVTHTVTASAPPTTSNACAASDLTGTFSELAGSAGAGNIVYTLHVTNAAQQTCTLTGIPTVTFLDANGAEMNQHTDANVPQAPVVSLAPGGSASSQIRFSPDVSPCDPGIATTLRVELADRSTFQVKLDPPTKLCGAGSVQPANFKTAD